MATNRPRVTISLSARTSELVKEFQKQNEYATASGAIQELIRIGLEVIKEEEKEKKKNGK